jgi:regulator of sigma E protease
MAFAVARVAAIVGLFLLLVGPHEGGHFAFAKLFGVKVHEYSIGMGTRIWSTVRSGTLYAVRAIPLGGYVRLAGMEPGDYEAPGGFHSKPAYQRLLILAAGPGVNFLVASLIMTGVYLAQVNDDPGRIAGVYQGSPAYAHGIRGGDSVQTIDGRPVRNSDDIRHAVDARGAQPLVLAVRHHNGKTETVTLTPVYNKDEKRALIGVQIAPVVSPLQAVGSGLAFPVVSAAAIAQGVSQVVSGQVPGGLLGPSGVSGAIGFSYIAYQAAAQGLLNYLLIAALLSVALGLTNLLPLPALDGGRMVVVLLEKLRGRPFDREREMAVQRYGLVALLALMVLIAFFDVQRIASGQFLGTR